MSITPAMKAAARSAYRNVYRASSVTFSGDEHVLKAFRLKMRNDAIAARGIIDPETYEQQNQLGREIADVLRKNIVQGVRVRNEEGTPDDQEIFRLRLTKYTELGSNDTIKNPPLMSNRSMRKQEKAAHHTSVTDVAPHNDSFAFFSRSHLSMNFSQLKKAHRERVLPELKEEDLEETFVRGLSKEDFARAKQRERERRRRKKAKKKAAEKVSQDEGILEEDDLDEEANLEEEDLAEEANLEEEDLDEEANLDTNHSRNTERHDEKS
ncbi:hypothetical protein C0989_003728 [Termitomyces sp. Mn162]|nr:hypothetical protein C0989_003728 [Termitomyces sp. Mn162]